MGEEVPAARPGPALRASGRGTARGRAVRARAAPAANRQRETDIPFRRMCNCRILRGSDEGILVAPAQAPRRGGQPARAEVGGSFRSGRITALWPLFVSSSRCLAAHSSNGPELNHEQYDHAAGLAGDPRRAVGALPERICGRFVEVGNRDPKTARLNHSGLGNETLHHDDPLDHAGYGGLWVV